MSRNRSLLSARRLSLYVYLHITTRALNPSWNPCFSLNGHIVYESKSVLRSVSKQCNQHNRNHHIVPRERERAHRKHSHNPQKIYASINDPLVCWRRFSQYLGSSLVDPPVSGIVASWKSCQAISSAFVVCSSCVAGASLPA